LLPNGLPAGVAPFPFGKIENGNALVEEEIIY
jgi:hypothetical protein